MKTSLLCAAFRNPESVLALTLQEWSLLIRQARRSNVLARLGHLLEAADILAKTPNQPVLHIQSGLMFAKRFETALGWEIDCIEKALETLGLPLVFLKGSAYHIAGNHAAKGRIFSDVDILVPEHQLPDVEVALIKAGWMSSTLDPYDQKYYRQWMHEIPPMRNLQRQTSIDVHHNILPKSCKFSPDARLLLANIVNIPGTKTWVLSPEDRVLHSASHLFHGGEFEQGFRDLSDLDLLLKEFSVTEGFWDNLLQRAQILKQQEALCYALRYTHAILGTPIPKETLQTANTQATTKMPRFLADWLFLRALQPHHSSCITTSTHVAYFVLYIRSHWLKMPLHLLIPHLLKKALKPLEPLFKKT